MNILFIGPVFNGYEKIIKKTIISSKKYKEVYFLPECPFNSLALFAFTTRIIPSSRCFLIKNHNDKIMKLIQNNDIDIIYIIRGEFLDAQMLEEMKVKKPKIKIIVYQWDSIHRSPNAVNLFRIADKAYTFDYKDSKDFGVAYMPLFYCWEEAGLYYKQKGLKYDVVSIGGYREHRLPYIKAMATFCKLHNMRCLFHNFERFGAYLINKKKYKTKWKDVNFHSLNYRKYFDILCQTYCVLDIPSPLQEGLTMRTMETLSLNKKLITTNPNIQNEPFYNDNIFLISKPEDINTPDFLAFIRKPLVENEGLLSLTAWLNKQGVI